jgi:hypothetical protein
MVVKVADRDQRGVTTLRGDNGFLRSRLRLLKRENERCEKCAEFINERIGMVMLRPDCA